VAFLSLAPTVVGELVPRLFVIVPADWSGRRAQVLRRPEADFALARAVRRGEALLGDVCSYLGVSFRGQLAYATRFGTAGPLVITPGDGLQSPRRKVGIAELARWATIDPGTAGSVERLKADAERLAATRPRAATLVLLESPATSSCIGILEPIFGAALLVPRVMRGRGGSPGAHLLRAAEQGAELDYVPASAIPPRGTIRSVA
jgi:hypothetical protein